MAMAKAVTKEAFRVTFDMDVEEAAAATGSAAKEVTTVPIDVDAGDDNVDDDPPLTRRRGSSKASPFQQKQQQPQAQQDQLQSQEQALHQYDSNLDWNDHDDEHQGSGHSQLRSSASVQPKDPAATSRVSSPEGQDEPSHGHEGGDRVVSPAPGLRSRDSLLRSFKKKMVRTAETHQRLVQEQMEHEMDLDLGPVGGGQIYDQERLQRRVDTVQETFFRCLDLWDAEQESHEFCHGRVPKRRERSWFDDWNEDRQKRRAR